MSIQEHLNKIRNAIYGREVRESIAKGIETAYDDASENDNANMEVKLARGTNPNLNTRLNKMEDTDRQVTTQLAQTKNELEIKKITRNENESIGMEMLKPDIKQALNNGEWEISVNTSDIEDGAVTREKLNFLKKSTNLFNVDNEIKGYRISPDNGDLIKDATYNTSEIIRVKPGDKFTSKGLAAVGFYDENMVFLSRGALTLDEITWGATELTHYIRVHYQPSNNVPPQLNSGETLLSYERGHTPIAESLTEEDGSIVRRKLEPSLSGFNNNRTELIYSEGYLTTVNTKENDVVINSIRVNYDETGKILNIVETEDGKQVTSTLNENSLGVITSVTNSTMEVL